LQQVDAVVVQPGWWKALRLLEDGGMVLEKPVEHGALGGGGRDCRHRPQSTQARGCTPYD
jgi:hypothetical protein